MACKQPATNNHVKWCRRRRISVQAKTVNVHWFLLHIFWPHTLKLTWSDGLLPLPSRLAFLLQFFSLCFVFSPTLFAAPGGDEVRGARIKGNSVVIKEVNLPTTPAAAERKYKIWKAPWLASFSRWTPPGRSVGRLFLLFTRCNLDSVCVEIRSFYVVQRSVGCTHSWSDEGPR